MLDALQQYLSERGVLELARDALDIFIVYLVTYRVLLLVKGTRAQHVGLGLLVIFGLYVVAQLLQLVMVLSILSSLITSIILVVVVVFQNDIRRGLIRVGSRKWLPWQAQAKESHVIAEVVKAATDLARHRIGAIIAFEQDANLDEFVGVNKGKEVDAAVSNDLLVSLFLPEAMNRLHDGAVIIRNLRIAKAGVFFPMPEGKVLDQQFGSRHRAAVGITEETDAVVVVVSEERGTISCCFNGNIAPDLNGVRLSQMLESIFNPRPRRRRSPPPPAVIQPEEPTESRREAPPNPQPAAEEEAEADVSTTAPLRIEPADGAVPSTRITVVPENTDEREPKSERPPPPLRPRAPSEPDGIPPTTSPPWSTPIPVEPRPMPRADNPARQSSDEIEKPPSGGDR